MIIECVFDAFDDILSFTFSKFNGIRWFNEITKSGKLINSSKLFYEQKEVVLKKLIDNF